MISWSFFLTPKIVCSSPLTLLPPQLKLLAVAKICLHSPHSHTKVFPKNPLASLRSLSISHSSRPNRPCHRSPSSLVLHKFDTIAIHHYPPPPPKYLKHTKLGSKTAMQSMQQWWVPKNKTAHSIRPKPKISLTFTLDRQPIFAPQESQDFQDLGVIHYNSKLKDMWFTIKIMQLI
jgi:hypothetical protein